MNTPLFPSIDSLCEACGYALRGLQPAGDCPECGQSIAESSPDLRWGPSWQAKRSLRSGCQTIVNLAFKPKKFYRTMRVDGSNKPARQFQAAVATLMGLCFLVLDLAWTPSTLYAALIHTFIVIAGVVLLSSVEATGVVYFSRRRGWRIPRPLAKRLVCYASIGWAPTAVVMGLALSFFANGSLERWMLRLFGTWDAWQGLELLILIGAVAMMWFEVLVWIGVRQTRFANS